VPVPHGQPHCNWGRGSGARGRGGSVVMSGPWLQAPGPLFCDHSRVPKALITGITGQDGSYLAEFLLARGYEVHGLKRRSSSFNTDRLDHLYADVHQSGARLFLHYADLADSSSLAWQLSEIAPDEIYNLGAQSHVKVSFEIPEYTAEVVGVGA